jgi:putative transposase
LACYQTIEMNPVRAAMVAVPEDCPWSSVHANAFGHPDPLLISQTILEAVATTTAERQSAYRLLLRQSISEEELHDIRAYVQQQRALGSTRFQAAIETALGRCASVRPSGRPLQAHGISTALPHRPANNRDK